MVLQNLIDVLQKSKMNIESIQKNIQSNNQDETLKQQWETFVVDFEKIFEEYTKNPLNYKQTLIGYEEYVSDCHTRYKKLNEEFKELKKKKITNISEMKKENEKMLKKIEELETEQKNKNEELTEKNNQNDEMIKKIENFEKEKADLNISINNKNYEINEIKEKNNADQITIQELKTVKDDLEKKISELQSVDMDDSETKKNEYKTKIKELTDQITSLTSSSKENTTKIKNQTKEIEKLKQKIEQKELEEKQMLHDYTSLRDELEKSRNDYKNLSIEYENQMAEKDAENIQVKKVMEFLTDISKIIGFQPNQSLNDVSNIMIFMEKIKQYIQDFSEKYNVISSNLNNVKINFSDDEYTERLNRIIKQYIDFEKEKMEEISNNLINIKIKNSYDLKNLSKTFNIRTETGEQVLNAQKITYDAIKKEIDELTEKINSGTDNANKIENLKHGFENLNNLKNFINHLSQVQNIFYEENKELSKKIIKFLKNSSKFENSERKNKQVTRSNSTTYEDGMDITDINLSNDFGGINYITSPPSHPNFSDQNNSLPRSRKRQSIGSDDPKKRRINLQNYTDESDNENGNKYESTV